MIPGVLGFGDPTLRFGLVIDGVTIIGGAESLQWRHGEAVATAEYVGGGTVSQSLWTAPDAPLALAPYEGSLSFRLIAEGDYEAILDAFAAAEPVEMFFGWWQVDKWLIGAAPGTQTEWKTSRPYAWSLASRASYPPSARLDATPQTVLATGTPGAGEVMIPDSGGGTEGVVTTPAASGLGAAILRVKYPALFNVVTVPSWGCSQVNELQVDLEVREMPAGQYS